MVKSYDYDAFGNEKAPDPNDTNLFRYCGEYFDKETGTIYLRARYYDPEIGRFITEDSVWGKDADPLSLNLYTYCGNDPVLFTDPTGHITQQDKDKYKHGEINFYQWQTIVAIGEKWDSVNNMKDLNGEAKALARKEIHELADNFRQNGYHWESGDNLVSGDRLPDFWSLTVNAGSLAGGTIAITWDVYGKRYIGLGGNVGKSATLVSGSFTVNWVIQSTQPDAKTLEGYCSGWGINVGAGNGLGGGITKVPGQAHSVLGVGVYTPKAGASVVYSWKVYDPNDPKPKPTNPADAYRYHPYVPGSVWPPNPSYRP